MAEANFRSSLNQFRWARGNTDDSRPAQAPASNGGGNGHFSRFYESVSSYVPLRSSESSTEEQAYLALSHWERLLGFLGCLVGSAVCFFVAFITLPMLAIRPGKFALAFSLGSLLVMFGFAILSGPINHLKHLMSPARLPFTIAYFGSLFLTLFFSVGGHKSYFGAIISAIIQVIALISYVVAYFPGGTQTLRFGSQIMLRGAGNVLPV
ncbi:hypothetical protein BOTBODRAFT_172665 [Botryobasidium botryosum FD-172 SS1]|uniref:Protein transport protein SFT2 n=1 Tax=Botryobasidium botryosum (strain FD-172 SS1) TaxID=930990 RepID=A0A067MYT3_BOTB1|nr:hypothetical protein BOTBODRAFT_172665 [Botryobasidium botryosum FD-172 SS1]